MSPSAQPSRSARTITWLVRPPVLGCVSVVILLLAYAVLAESTQRPLTIFLIPILITAALGSWRDTVAVGAVATAAAVVAGSLHDNWNWAGLSARLVIMAVGWAVAVAVAFERHRRQQVIERSRKRSLLLDVFQDSLVPAPIPPAGVTVSTRYIPGDDRLLLGGDFFDAIRLPNGSLGYIIGDVCGQGARAAALGAAVRSGWKTLATTAPDEPLRWVTGLDDTFFRLGRHTDAFVTLNTGVVELGDTRLWRFVSAGHPWPVVIGDRVHVVEPVVGPPLGAGQHEAWAETSLDVVGDTTILMYTDGLIENAAPGERRRNDGEGRLVDYLERHPFDLEHLLARFGPEGFDDDVAVVAIAFN